MRYGSRFSTRLPALAALAAMAMALPACGGDGARTVDDIPSDAVAIVGDDPITVEELSARMREFLGAAPPGTEAGAALERQALGNLVNEAVLVQEAERRGVEVSEAEVRRKAAEIEAQMRELAWAQSLIEPPSDPNRIRSTRRLLLERAIDEHAAEEGDDRGLSAPAVIERWHEITACLRRYATVSYCGDYEPPPEPDQPQTAPQSQPPTGATPQPPSPKQLRKLLRQRAK